MAQGNNLGDFGQQPKNSQVKDISGDGVASFRKPLTAHFRESLLASKKRQRRSGHKVVSFLRKKKSLAWFTRFGAASFGTGLPDSSCGLRISTDRMHGRQS